MKPENGNCNSSSCHSHLLGEKCRFYKQHVCLLFHKTIWSKADKSVAISLTCCRLPAELSHWWGGRRGRTGGGGAILWGATDRDGMGGPGEGRQGRQRRGNSPPVTTPRHHTRTPPHNHNVSLFILFLSFLSFTHTTCLFSCYGGLTCACLCWTLASSRIVVADSICCIS